MNKKAKKLDLILTALANVFINDAINKDTRGLVYFLGCWLNENSITITELVFPDYSEDHSWG
jgi:hypothetical protein